MNTEEINDVVRCYVKAGEIAYRVKKNARRLVKPGVRIIEIAESIEREIKELGGLPAFPVNISVNEVAAHRTPYIDDAEVIPEASAVKVDIGVHVNGYIADTAVTVVLDDKLIPLAEAAHNALMKALKAVKPGAKFREIGKIIENTARKAGFKVIKNLSGHSLGHYLIHGGEVIPNYNDPFVLGRFRTGKAYAIEPFVTTGKGVVKEAKGKIQIYSLRRVKGKPLSESEHKVLSEIIRRFKTLPFCERWLVDVGSASNLRASLTSLARKGYLNQYPVLVEAGGGLVTQFEETILITHDGDVIVTTNPEIHL